MSATNEIGSPMSASISSAIESSTNTVSLTRKSPTSAIIDTLLKASARYVPVPYLCDAVFVNKWFEVGKPGPEFSTEDRNRERLFSMLHEPYQLASVISIKHLFLHRNGKNPEQFRLRWSQMDEIFSEIFLVTCVGLSDHVAVIPTSYLKTRFGDAGSMVGDFEPDMACPSMLAPFMVHRAHLPGLLSRIYHHANSTTTSDIVNPTYGATYHGWQPQLRRLRDVLPLTWQMEKLLRMRELYDACRLAQLTMRLSYREEPGHFTLEGHAVEHWRKTWCSFGSNMIHIELQHHLLARSGWEFVLLEDFWGREAICLPRDMVPSWLIDTTGHGRYSTGPKERTLDVDATPWESYIFSMRDVVEAVRRIDSIMKRHTRREQEGSD